MCEERERLIGFVYDECDSAERQTIEEHLSTCPTCRHEIAGLRGVRQDLLAWKVPEHESLWRPVAPPRVESPWQAIPAWAMAAAAGLMLTIGAAGGAATYAFLPRTVTATNAAPTDGVMAQREAALTALERRLIALESAGVASAPRTETVSTGRTSADVEALRARTDSLTRQVEWLASQQDTMRDSVTAVYMSAADARARQVALENKTNNFIRAASPQSEAPQGFLGTVR